MIRILGIDPGSQRTGIGVIDVAADGKATHVFHATINLLDNDSFHLRLRPALTPLEGDTETRAAAINREMEAQIRENPAQYL